MWKYCVEIYQYRIRRQLEKPWLWFCEGGLYNYTEQRYFKTKEEARKGRTAAIREMRRFLNERRAITGNCHEIVEITREKNGNVHLCIHNRFERVSRDSMWVLGIKKVK